MSLRQLIQRGLLLALFFGAGAAPAGSFSVNPVRVTLTPAEPIAALTVRNSGDEPAVVQLEATSWTQEGGKDHYQRTRDLLATPPIFTVPPRGSQVVRIGLRRAADPGRELTFRLYVQEVPPPPPPNFVGMRVALRFGVPVFVPPAVMGEQALQWQLLRGADGRLSLACLNNGAVHARIAEFSLSPEGSTALPAQPVAVDVHAGQRREWVLNGEPIVPPGTAMRLSAKTERGDVHADLVAP